MATNVGTSSQLSMDQAIDWLAEDVTSDVSWNSETPPAPWDNNLAAVQRIVGTVLAEFQYGDDDTGARKGFRPSLRKAYRSGYTMAHLTKGYHQKEIMVCLLLGGGRTVCHLTFRLAKPKNKGDYKTVHIYVTSDGHIAGATLWDAVLHRPIS